MKSGWEVRPLGEAATFIGGGTPSKQNASYWTGDIPWVSPKDMKSDIIIDTEDKITEEAIVGSATQLVPQGSVLIVVRSGILARAVPTAIAGRDVTINQDLKALRPSKAIEPRYLAYFVRAAESELLKKVTRGATVHRLETEHLKKLPFPLPPLEEQRRMVAILDEAHDGLARARANVETSRAEAWSMFASLREKLFDPSQDGWSKLPLRELIQIRHGFAFQGEYFGTTRGDVLLTPGNFFERGGFRDRGVKQKLYDGPAEPAFRLSAGDLLVAMTEQAPGLLGSSMIVPEGRCYLHNQRLGLVKGRQGVTFLAPFFAHIFNLSHLRAQLSETCTGIKVRVQTRS